MYLHTRAPPGFPQLFPRKIPISPFSNGSSFAIMPKSGIGYIAPPTQFYNMWGDIPEPKYSTEEQLKTRIDQKPKLFEEVSALLLEDDDEYDILDEFSEIHGNRAAEFLQPHKATPELEFGGELLDVLNIPKRNEEDEFPQMGSQMKQFGTEIEKECLSQSASDEESLETGSDLESSETGSGDECLEFDSDDETKVLKIIKRMKKIKKRVKLLRRIHIWKNNCALIETDYDWNWEPSFSSLDNEYKSERKYLRKVFRFCRFDKYGRVGVLAKRGLRKKKKIRQAK